MSLRCTFPMALAVLVTACASGTRGARSPAHATPAREARAGVREPDAGSGSSIPAAPIHRLPHDVGTQRAIDAARELVGQRELALDGVRLGDDCVALVQAALAKAGAPLPAGVTHVGALHALAKERGLLRRVRPEPGDLVFLADRPGGSASHVGLVEKVAADGTALVLHRTGRGVARLRVNVAHPWTLKNDAGRLVNDPLVTGAGRVPAGRLFVAWASLL